MSVFQGHVVNDNCYYKVQSDGNAPANLGVGDLVVTSAGTYLITSVIIPAPGQSQYTAILYDKNITTTNFKGTYLTPSTYNDFIINQAQERQTVSGSSVVSGGINDSLKEFDMPDNYIYFYHLDQFILLPLYADSVQDSMSATFEQQTPLSRSAPIYSYKNSGPRTVQVGFDLHRDMMTDINYRKSNVPVGPALSDDYVDILIKYLQAAVLPVYNATNKMVNPPIVAMRLGKDIFIKGVVNGSVGLTYKFPILKNGKYALVSINFQISEVDPYDAWDAVNYGSYRGLDTTLEARLTPQQLGGSNVISSGGANARTVRNVSDRDIRIEDI